MKDSIVKGEFSEKDGVWMYDVIVVGAGPAVESCGRNGRYVQGNEMSGKTGKVQSDILNSLMQGIAL